MLPEPAVNALRDLSQEEVIALIQRLFEEVRRLEAEVRTLREELEQYKKPPTTSQNSSQPPSRDWKADRPRGKRRKKVGAKVGHAKAERPLVDNPEKVIEVWVETCAACGTGLLDQAPERVIRRQVTELPEIQPVVITYINRLSDLLFVLARAVNHRAGAEEVPW